jgi:ABC-type sulfate transport system permease subunit
MNQSSVSFIKGLDGRVLTLARPVLPHAARRLVSVIPQLNALNTAGKSQADAAEAMGVSVGCIRNWITLANIPWSNLNKRGPYKTNA